MAVTPFPRRALRRRRILSLTYKPKRGDVQKQACLPLLRDIPTKTAPAERPGALSMWSPNRFRVASAATPRKIEARVRDQVLTSINAPGWLIERPIAHRGLHDEAKGVIENTLAAAEAAIAGGFAIECDVQSSSDGEAFVFHDETLDRLTDASGAISAKSAAEIVKIRIKGSNRPPTTFADFLKVVAGRTPVVCELKSRFDGDWRVGDRVVALAASYDGPLALKSFDHDLAGYLRLRRPRTRLGDLCPIGVVAEASYDDPIWAFLTAEQKRAWTDFDHFDRTRPDFLSFNIDDLPHKIPFLMKELHGAPIMAWTVRTREEREAALKWVDQIVFEGAGRP
jgi:glycerophosphoryl diester phosphodiesterase